MNNCYSLFGNWCVDQTYCFSVNDEQLDRHGCVIGSDCWSESLTKSNAGRRENGFFNVHVIISSL